MPQPLAAVIVTFNEVAGAAALLVDQLSKIADTIIVVDNTPNTPAPRISGAIGIANGNIGGLAGAYNAALHVLPDDIGLVVFVDQDSEASVLPSFLADTRVKKLLQSEDIAAVAPIYCDRRTGMRGSPIRLESRWRVSRLARDFTGLSQTTTFINSMTVWRRAALEQLGPFDTRLGVDHIDTDMALRAADQNLEVWISGDHVFAHSIGEQREWRFLGRRFQTTRHSPDRRRQFARNLTILARRWAIRFPAFSAMSVAILGYQAAGIVAVEDRKMAKLGALGKGALIGLFARR